ncbi:MAG TPA: FhaA domain-containing protein [Pyrinomonadaceae bacterium]|nr:FhaA domain-containing protein [Pyrinomonadaceae bacterium]
MSVLDKVRRWIDGESAELVLEEAARDAQVKPRSQAEAFIVKIARAVEKVMQDEMVPLPQGTTIIPSEYTIFLSSDDDKEWQGVKRKGLEQGLYHILAERAKEIAGKKKLETKSFVIELRIDATLEKGEVRVQHGWEDSSGSKTGVLARPKPVSSDEPKYRPPTATQPNYAPASANQRQTPTSPNFTQPQQVRQVEPPPTIASGQIAQPAPNEDGEVMTQVHKRAPELYKLEIWRNGVRQNVVPIYQNQVTVGRGSKSKPVDISLVGDAEISRRHLTLNTDGQGNYWVINEGRNPAMINSYELPEGQRVQVSPGMSVAICSYVLRIQPK